MGLATAATLTCTLIACDAAGASQAKAPARCPSTGSMSKSSGTKMANLQVSKTRHSLSCSYVNGSGNVYVSYVIEHSGGESVSGFWAGMQRSAHQAHAKLHKFRAGRAAAWYSVSKHGAYGEVLVGKQEISIEDQGQSGRTLAKIAEAFI
jgi:RecJ-like exonuclease